MKEHKLTAEKINFQGENGYMVKQYRNGEAEAVCECFVPDNAYESYCLEIGEKPELVN